MLDKLSMFPSFIVKLFKKLILATFVIVVVYNIVIVPDIVEQFAPSQLETRAVRVREYCEDVKHGHKTLVHWRGFRESGNINGDTNMRFRLNQRNFQICSVLKGGSLSWKTFFEINRIPFNYIRNCQDENICGDDVEVTRLMQVRHPFERLLSAWRHIFQAEGWKNLEVIFINNNQRLKQEAPRYNISWQRFIQEIVIEDRLDIKDMNDYDAQWVWLR